MVDSAPREGDPRRIAPDTDHGPDRMSHVPARRQLHPSRRADRAPKVKPLRAGVDARDESRAPRWRDSVCRGLHLAPVFVERLSAVEVHMVKSNNRRSQLRPRSSRLRMALNKDVLDLTRLPSFPSRVQDDGRAQAAKKFQQRNGQKRYADSTPGAAWA